MAAPQRALMPPEHTVPHQSAVLAPLYMSPHGIALLLTRRSLTLSHHKGQVCFPGGRADKADQTLIETALRETEEELGIHTRHVRILGSITPLYVAASQNIVYPVVGWMASLPPLYPNAYEVAKVLKIPLQTFLNPETQSNYELHYNGQITYAPCYQVGEDCIWGATAMMLSELLDIIDGMLTA